MVPPTIIRSAAANANPDAVHPPERTDAITLSRNRCDLGLDIIVARPTESQPVELSHVIDRRR
jgi:hypothetical protein